LETPIALAIGAAGGALISAVVTGFSTLRAKRAEYVNEYYKMVLAKRMAAYEQMEAFIISLKTAVFDDTDKRHYHWLFARDDDLLSAYKLVLGIISQALWLSAEAFEKARDFNYRIFQPKPVGNAIQFGKENYTAIATLRDELEIIVAADMRHLHNVKRFLKQKAKRRPMGFVVAPDGVPRKN
jgi:hypothetical protein